MLVSRKNKKDLRICKYHFLPTKHFAKEERPLWQSAIKVLLKWVVHVM